MTNTRLELPCPKKRRNADEDQNFAANLQEVTNISMEIKVREYEQMMLGGYIELVPVNLFIQFLIQSAVLYQFLLCFVKTITLQTSIQN